jgi:hypothetical protein
MSVPSLSWQTIAPPPPPLPAILYAVLTYQPQTRSNQINVERIVGVYINTGVKMCWVQVAATATGAAHGELLVDLSDVPVRNTHARSLYFPCSFFVSPNLDGLIYAKPDSGQTTQNRGHHFCSVGWQGN